MKPQLASMEAENLQKDHTTFQDILSEAELTALFAKYKVEDIRERKLWVRCFFWLMIFSAGESSRRGSLLLLIGFFIGAMSLLFPEQEAVLTLSKTAVSKRLQNISWYLFRGVYNHLLAKYKAILGADEMKFLSRFKDAWAIDGSVISLSKQVERVFTSVHKGKSSLKLNTRFSLKIATVNKLQVSSGKRHDSRFAFVTQEANHLYLVDLGYWSFALLQKIIDAGSFFVMRLKHSCDPLILAVSDQQYSHLCGQRLSEISTFLKEQCAHDTIDFTVHLSKAKKPRFQESIRLVGCLHDGQWRFYITNICAATFTPQLIYALYAQRWQVEIFFNLVKNVLNLQNIISRTKNGIMIEIYSALIFYLLTRIVIALAAQKADRSYREFSFERSFKLMKGFLLPHFHLCLQGAWSALDVIFHKLVDLIAAMGLASRSSKLLTLENQLVT